MELTREEAIRLHRELWGWLAENPMKGKTNWPGWHEKFDNRISDCFLCEYAGFDGAFSKCENCPVVFVKNTHIKGTTPYCLGGLFFQWYHASAPEERSRLAALIRDLPEKQVEKPKRELKIGDWVEVLNTGGCHTTYDTFFKLNNLDQFAGKFRSGGNPVIGVAHKIVAIGKYKGKSNDCYGPLYVIEASNGQVYIMNNSHKELELTDPPKIEPKFKEGDRVVPVSKSDGKSWERWKEANNHNCRFLAENGYLYISEQSDIKHLVLGVSPSSGGDFFLESDLRPYVEPPKFKFAVGDKVRAIAETNGWGKVKEGDIGTITHTPDTHPRKDEYEHYKDRYRVDFPAQKEWDGKEECFELFTEPEPPARKFKVGDIVCGNAQSDTKYNTTTSKITKGEVVALLDDGCIDVKVLEHTTFKEHIGRTYTVDEKYFELVTEEPKAEAKPEPKQNKFSVGDKVKCIRVYDYKEEALGKIGNIIDVNKTGDYYAVQFNEDIDGHSGMHKGVEGKDGYCWCFAPEYLELVKDEPKQEPRVFKVGDRVRVRSWEEMLKEFGLDDDGDISIPGEPCFNRAMQYLCGQKFTVTKTDGIWVEGLDSGGWNITVSMLESLPINHCPEK